ncbi:recQ4 helicase [Andrena cerasifolii]|uniref:recQ4 helicase n=1 Tax=Andrena cerasifolii TaxID=2819439 RepID=UPI004038012A
MEILQDPVFKTNYQKYKVRVKLWESSFTEKHGRKPNKNDIKEADMKIKESYKMYWKLKTRALEETLIDITFSDDVQENAAGETLTQTSIGESKNDNELLVDCNKQTIESTDIKDTDKKDVEALNKVDIEAVSKDVETTDRKGMESLDTQDAEHIDKKNIKNTDPRSHSQPIVNTWTTDEVDTKNVKGVWGDHLSKSNEQAPRKKQPLIVGRSSSFQLSQNKFTSSSSIKRNPRKSLSTTKFRSKSEKSINGTNESKEQIANVDVNKRDGFDVHEAVKPIFGETVKVTYVEPKFDAHSISSVEQLVKGHTVNRNLNPGWLDRCAKQNNVEYPAFDSQRLSGKSDSGIESMESSIQLPSENTPLPESSKSPWISDEEDFVCNSDTEEERRHKRIRNFKRLGDQDNYPAKRVCMEKTYVPAAHRQNNINAQPASLIENRNTGVNEQKTCMGINATGTPAATNDRVNDNRVSNVTNLASDSVKCNDKLNDTSETKAESADVTSVKQPRRRRVIRRIKDESDNSDADFNETDREETKKKQPKKTRATSTRKTKASTKGSTAKAEKKNASDESDADFNETDKKETKKKEPKKTRATSTKKTKASTKGSTAKGEKKNTGERRKSSRKKKDAQGNEDLETEPVDSESTKDEGPAIYGIEMLDAVPRFAMTKNSQGDLIEQFTQTVNFTADSFNGDSAAPKKAKGKLTGKETLEKKVADGKINENFVRINLKRKVFVRGKKHFNFSKYKKNQWKERKKELGSGEGSLDVADFVEKHRVMTCFKCGDVGHFSRSCPNSKGDNLIPMDEIDDGSMYPTLEEAQSMASQNAVAAHASRISRLPEKPAYSAAENESLENESVETETAENKDINEDLWEPIEDEEILCGHKVPEDLVLKLLPPDIGTVQPLYNPEDNQTHIEAPSEVLKTLHRFGHTAFRPGQEKAVMRILSGQSTLVTLSTGSGKSLCYQLPAYMYSQHFNCITLVISPLVSLMDDQVTGVPSFLSAACLHTNQTQKVRDNVMQMVKQGKLNILLISPEAVVAGEKSTGFGALLRQLPPIAFACIDEAHCISQWSHNFRPSYLMVCRVLREKLGVRTVLALTATATKATAEGIVSHLGIHDGMQGVISDIPMPRNLLLTVSKDDSRDQALVKLLQSKRFEECDSIIVYCTRREECARIAGLLRVSLRDERNDVILKSTLSRIAEVYHAGLSAHRRKIVQKSFMNGEIRIVVATVAFGMGLNKSDIRSVIHYNMPGTFESYVQEVGRSGRDGLMAHCHLFLNPTEDKDKWELRRHIYAKGVDRHTIRRLLQKVFLPCSCARIREKNPNHRCPGHEVAIPVAETVAALDISEETIATLLCYLELHSKRFITVLSSVYVRARVSSYSGPQALKHAAQSSPPLAMAIALDLQKGISHENSSTIEFPVVDVASAIGWDSGVVKSHLKSLEWKTVNGASKRSAISVKYDKLGLRVKAPGDLTDVELDEALDALVSRAQSQETSALQQLETIGVTLHKFSTPAVTGCLMLNEEMESKSDELKTVIRRYFQGEGVLIDIDWKQHMKVEKENEVVGDVRNLVISYRDNNFTGRAVARIFHGIQSPNYPAYVWNKCRFWRAHLSCNFNGLCQIATREILALR